MIGSYAFKQKQMMLNYVFVLHFIANIDIKIDLSVYQFTLLAWTW